MDDNKEKIVDGFIVIKPESLIEKAFTEWERRRRANPEDFPTDEEIAGESPETYGSQAAEYFKSILEDIRK